MTYKEIAEMIAEADIPYAYREFEEGTATAPPFICFFYPYTDDFFADDSNYQRVETLVVELYTDTKDIALEQALEAVFADHGLTFTRSEERLGSERMTMNTYTMEVIINGEQN